MKHTLRNLLNHCFPPGEGGEPRFQFLRESMTTTRDRDTVEGRVTEISFFTTEVTTTQIMLNEEPMCGVVVWLPTRKVMELMRRTLN